MNRADKNNKRNASTVSVVKTETILRSKRSLSDQIMINLVAHVSIEKYVTKIVAVHEYILIGCPKRCHR